MERELKHTNLNYCLFWYFCDLLHISQERDALDALAASRTKRIWLCKYRFATSGG